MLRRLRASKLSLSPHVVTPSRSALRPARGMASNRVLLGRRTADSCASDHMLFWGLAGVAASSLLLAPAFADKRESKPEASRLPVLEVDGQKEFTTVIVGGGTAGCTVAYLLAKWMEEKDLPGTVLLVERGHDNSAKHGPDPRLKSWFDIWGGFGEAHTTVHKTGEHYPATATDHRGLGGCSTHDTRINFQLPRSQLERMAAYMGWEIEQIQTYFQVALNLIPVSRSVPATRPEAVLNNVIATLTSPDAARSDTCGTSDVTLQRVLASDEPGAKARKPMQDNEFNTLVKPNSIAEVSMSMYGNAGAKEGSDEVRFASAFLLHEKVRPKNLKVVCNMTADRVLLEPECKSSSCSTVRAAGVEVRDDAGKTWVIQLGSPVGGPGHGDVVVTNGSLGATGLLQRSGIGPEETLKEAGVGVVVDNPEVGHGVDHIEVSLVNKWNNSQAVTRSGATGWPLVLFADIEGSEKNARRNVKTPFAMYRPNSYFQAHFGAGIVDPNYDEPIMQMTPLVVSPDPDAGFRGHITSRNPKDSLLVVHEDQTSDLEVLCRAVRKGVQMFEKMERAGLCGARILPPPEIPLHDTPQLIEWIKDNHWTVYHWSSTCKAGLPGIGTVADETFRVRCKSSVDASNSGVISNLFVGSAASLPEISEPNPHLTITAFSVALAEQLLKSQYFAKHNAKQEKEWKSPREITQASKDLDRSAGDGNFPTCVIRRQGEERPDLWRSVVKRHVEEWMEHHPDDHE